MNHNDIPTSVLLAAANSRNKSGPARLGDFNEPFLTNIRPASSIPLPKGPSDFPVQTTQPETQQQTLDSILQELKYQNIASSPVIRSKDVDSTGQTLDWTPIGIMDRLMMRNKGPNSLWFSFDKNGPAVVASTSDESFELQANESINLTHCRFQKVGVKCSGGTATVHAIGWQSVAGNQGAAIS